MSEDTERINMLIKIWNWLRNEDNRGALSLIGGGFTTLIAAVWIVYTYQDQPDPVPSGEPDKSKVKQIDPKKKQQKEDEPQEVVKNDANIEIPSASIQVKKVDDKIRIRLNGKLVYEGRTTGWVVLPILQGENQMELEVFNQASKTGGIGFLGGAKREGWNYSVIVKSGVRTWPYNDGENVPPKSRWGTWFTVQNLKIVSKAGQDSISISVK